MHDVVIIGAGPAGIVLALELAEAGIDVALVESGGFEFDPDTQMLYDGTVTGHDVFDLTAIRLRYFGGTSNHWGGHCSPLDPIDFARRPLSGLSGWPFGRADLEPYYVRANSWCRLGEVDYRPGVRAGLSRSDFLLPDAADGIEHAVLRISPGPVRFGEVYRSRVLSAPTLTLHLDTSAVGFVLDGDDRIAAVEVQGPDGARRAIAGRTVVLATGAVESARLLMAANVRLDRRFGDAGGYLGRCYMDHPAVGAAFLTLDSPATPKAEWRAGLRDADGTLVYHLWRLSDAVLEAEGLANAQFYLLPFSDDPAERARAGAARRADRALRDIARWTLGRSDGTVQLSAAYCDFITNADAFAERQWQAMTGGERVRRLLLKAECEQLPDRENRIALTDATCPLGLPLPALHWAPGAAERESVLASTIRIGAVCGALGLGRIELERNFERPFFGSTTSWHQMGTMRMAANPMEGVVDPDCRVHGTRNLFVASGAVMPSVGRANPTLTILALSIRLGDHLKAEVRAL